jgi:hypothetical protein
MSKLPLSASEVVNILKFYRDQSLSEPMELQLDYWLVPGKASEAPAVGKSSKGDTTKSTLKTTFRSLQIQRLPLFGEQPTQHFLMSYSTKEKKQKSKHNYLIHFS